MAKITNTNSATKAILSFLDVYGNTVNIPYGQTESADINETTRAKLITLNNVVDGVAYGTTVSGSGLDQNTTGATLNGATNQLTLTGDDGMAPVNVDLTALKAVSVADSLTGDGTAATPVKLVGDLTTPGNNKYYGTDATGNKSYHALPANVTPSTVTPLDSVLLGATGTSVNYSREDHKHPFQAPSVDANNAITLGADGKHFLNSLNFGKYKGLYSNTLPYEANDIVIDSNNVLWKSNFNRAVGVWSAQPTEGIAANQFTRLTGKDKGVFNFQNNYVIDDVVYDSTSTIGNNPGWYRATAAHSSGNAPAAVNWSSLALGSNRVHLSDTSVAPAIGGQPTLAEITASLGFFIPSPPRDTILHYTGDDSPASVTTHVYHVDRVGNITPLSSGGVSEFIGADTLTAGQAGTVPAPAIGNDQRFLASNGIWKEVDKTIPEWAPFLPTQIGKLWRINVGSVYLLLMSAINGVTNGALNSSEYANMILLAQSSIDGHPENKSVPKGFKFNFGGKIWQATTPRDVPAGFPTVALTGFESIGEGNLARASLSIAGLAHVVGTHVENNHPGAVTVTLPSGIDGCRLRYTDGAGVTSTFTTIISPAPGERLMGSVGQQYLLNWAGGSVTFVYFSAARGWIVE